MPILVVLAAILACYSSLAAQPCEPEHLPGQGWPGINGTVYACTDWDPDGPGPASSVIVVAGTFSIAGDTLCRALACWDGQRWNPMGSQFSTVRSVAAGADGALYASGSMYTTTEATEPAIARWNGVAWQKVADAIVGNIYTMLVLPSGDLLVGGDFTSISHIGGLSRLARWNGTNWSAFNNFTGNRVSALAALPEGGFVVGGDFSIFSISANHIAARTGATWDALDNGLPEPVLAVVVRMGQIIAATRYRVWKYEDFRWVPMGERFDGPIAGLHVRPDRSILVFGSFAKIGSLSAANIARWGGTGWITCGSGIGSELADSAYALVSSAASLPDNTTLVAGQFRYAGSAVASNIAQWKGLEWSGLSGGTGTSGHITSWATLPDGRLVAGGSFSLAGGVFAPMVAAFNGTSWARLATSFGGSSLFMRSVAATPNGDIYLGGTFDSIDGRSAKNIARKIGSTWQPLGVGTTGSVHTIAVGMEGDVFVGGQFLKAGGIDCDSVARWNGTWSAVGGGVKSGGVLGLVVALKRMTNGHIIVGGTFDTAGEIPAANIARWDGQAWRPLGDGVNGHVSCIEVLPNGDIVVGGSFSTAGSAAACKMARWDGAQWHALGAGLGRPGDYRSPLALLCLPSGDLLAGGSFDRSGPSRISPLARWTGSEWASFGPAFTPNASIWSLAIHNGQVLVGGSFTGVGGKASANWTRFICACYANCDGSMVAPRLTANDFQCFLNRFAASEPYANCDHSTGTPTLTASDFQCFLNKFAGGCP